MGEMSKRLIKVLEMAKYHHATPAKTTQRILEAMREPTEAMINAGCVKTLHDGRLGEMSIAEAFRNDWQAAIDEALK